MATGKQGTRAPESGCGSRCSMDTSAVVGPPAGAWTSSSPKCRASAGASCGVGHPGGGLHVGPLAARELMSGASTACASGPSTSIPRPVAPALVRHHRGTRSSGRRGGGLEAIGKLHSRAAQQQAAISHHSVRHRPAPAAVVVAHRVEAEAQVCLADLTELRCGRDEGCPAPCHRARCVETSRSMAT